MYLYLYIHLKIQDKVTGSDSRLRVSVFGLAMSRTYYSSGYLYSEAFQIRFD